MTVQVVQKEKRGIEHYSILVDEDKSLLAVCDVFFFFREYFEID